MKKFMLANLVVLVLVSTAFALGADIKPRKPTPGDKCPVCGMFVAKHADFAAQIQFKDGATFHFDGAKDLFKFYLDLPRYAPSRKSADISAAFVTGYYDLIPIDALTSFYVVGSDVYGPMGRELIPFAKDSLARDFMKDHQGNSVLSFRQVTPAAIKALD